MLIKNTSSLKELTPATVEVDSVSLFGALSPEQIVQLWGYLEARYCEPGESVFLQGDLPSEIYILISGHIDFVVERLSGAKVESSYGAGSTFGESAFIGIQPQVGSAIVAGLDAAELLVLSRGSLMAIHDENPALFGMLMMNLAREVSRKYHRQIETG